MSNSVRITKFITVIIKITSVARIPQQVGIPRWCLEVRNVGTNANASMRLMNELKLAVILSITVFFVGSGYKFK